MSFSPWARFWILSELRVDYGRDFISAPNAGLTWILEISGLCKILILKGSSLQGKVNIPVRIAWPYYWLKPIREIFRIFWYDGLARNQIITVAIPPQPWY